MIKAFDREFDKSLVILAIGTAIGAFGHFPEPPKFFKKLGEYELFKYLLLFILIWQGGSRQDPALALLLTVLIFVGIRVLDFIHEMIFPSVEKEQQ